MISGGGGDDDETDGDDGDGDDDGDDDSDDDDDHGDGGYHDDDDDSGGEDEMATMMMTTMPMMMITIMTMMRMMTIMISFYIGCLLCVHTSRCVERRGHNAFTRYPAEMLGYKVKAQVMHLDDSSSPPFRKSSIFPTKSNLSLCWTTYAAMTCSAQLGRSVAWTISPVIGLLKLCPARKLFSSATRSASFMRVCVFVSFESAYSPRRCWGHD